ncbi:MAG: alpha-galactosidase [Muribaculaceae bacterium]
MKIIKNIVSAAICAIMASSMAAQNVDVTTPGMSLLLSAPEGGNLKVLYFGSRLSDDDARALRGTESAHYDAYPAYGLGCSAETAIAVKHHDGNMTLELVVDDVKQESASQFTTTTVTLRDKVYPFTVKVCYKAYNTVDMIETWTEITNGEKKPVTLNQFASGYMPIRRGNVWLSSLYGQWANEARLCEEPLQQGMKVIKNKDGVRNSHTAHAEVMFSLDGKPRENSGRVIGAALCYSGNYRLRIDTDESNYHHFFAGINEDNSAYNLRSGETFVTPPLALTFSPLGLSGVSRNFHRWGRDYKLAHGNTPRKILLNSWEGVYFDINEAGMHQMMDDIAAMGGELFVMDDGWFGDKYPRLRDNTSLGDWVVDRNKLPNGIDGLLAHAKQKGIKFGIWYEPEMANTASELFEKHPDWVITAPKRELRKGRGGTQVVLDLANPKVQDFIVNLFDELMTKYPEIDYVKWDANMEISNHGSNYLTADNQSHLYIEYHRGFEKVCQRIRSKYPNLTMQACASGGGRANYGVLPYFDEFWVSDNTDALQRVYMQWGTSYFFPAIAMASHIAASPNHNTYRIVPLKYRIDVAMSGRLGMEIQPKNMTDDEKDLCRRAIEQYKLIRPVVQFGDLYRLLSPYDNQGAASLMYVTADKRNAVFFWWKTEHFYGMHIPRVPMAGLDAGKHYRVSELNRIDKTPLPCQDKVYSGEYLMNNGLEMPLLYDIDQRVDLSSRVLHLQAID